MKQIYFDSKNLINKHKAKIFLSFFIYCIFSIPILQFSKSGIATVWEFCLLSVFDQHYMMFCFLPIYLFVNSFAKNVDAIIIIRHKSFASFFKKSIIINSFFAFIYTSIPILTSLSIGLVSGLPFAKNSWRLISDEFISEPMLFLLKEHFKTPVLSLMYSYGYLIFALIFLSIVLNFATYIMNYKQKTIVVVSMYLYAFLSVQTGIFEDIPYLIFINYFVLPNAIVKGEPLVFVILMLLLLFFVVISIKNKLGFKKYVE